MAVVRSIRNLLLTRHYERLFNPDLGSNLDLILFEMVSPIAASALQKEIEKGIKKQQALDTVASLEEKYGSLTVDLIKSIISDSVSLTDSLCSAPL